MPRAIDLTGQKFGEITVLGRDIELSALKKRVYWKCQCSCGRTKSIRGDALKKTQTCGECKKDLTGQRFGRLVVQKEGKKDNSQHQYYFCLCDCGNIVEVNGDNLRRGLTKSCGCYRAEKNHQIHFNDLSGRKFGKLIVLNEYTVDGSGKAKWHCKCECGNDIWVTAYSLTSGNTKSCGCINYSIGEQNIIKILKENNIHYKKEYIFQDLPNRRFDFYLPDLNIVIEFDGKQHTEYRKNWNQTHEDFIAAQKRDKEKNKYCLDRGIPLYRIPYEMRDIMTLKDLTMDKFRVKTPDMEEAQEDI